MAKKRINFTPDTKTHGGLQHQLRSKIFHFVETMFTTDNTKLPEFFPNFYWRPGSTGVNIFLLMPTLSFGNSFIRSSASHSATPSSPRNTFRSCSKSCRAIIFKGMLPICCTYTFVRNWGEEK